MDDFLIVCFSVMGAGVYFWLGFGVARMEAIICKSEIRFMTVAFWLVALLVYATNVEIK
jgi:hypothetical protein